MVFRGGVGIVVSAVVAEAVGEVIVATRVVELLRTSGAGIVERIDTADEITEMIRGTAAAFIAQKTVSPPPDDPPPPPLSRIAERPDRTPRPEAGPLRPRVVGTGALASPRLRMKSSWPTLRFSSASLGGRQWQRKYLEGTGIFALQFRVSHEFDLPFHPIDRASECNRRGGRVQTLFDDCDRRSVTGDVHFVEATRGIFREQKDIAAN